MAYVMLGRCEDLSDVYINLVQTSKTEKPIELIAKKITCPPDALQEAKRLEEMSLSWKIHDKCHLSIVSLNIRSLAKHLPDIKSDFKLMQKDLLCFQETWVFEKDEANYNLDGHNSLFASHGKGKGLASFCKMEMQRPQKIMENSFQLLKMVVKDVTVISAYLSQDAELDQVMENLTNLVTKRTVIIGDMNFKAGSSNVMTEQLKAWNYSQLVEYPTQEKGNTIDHVYVSQDLTDVVDCDLHYVYYSDHQAVVLTVL